MRLNQRVMYGFMKLLTPKLKIEIERLQSKLSSISAYPRPFTLMLQKTFQKPLCGCEIGFGFGKNAESILKELNIKTLYLVEPFFGKIYVENNRVIDFYKTQNQSLIDRLESDDRVKFIRTTSDTAFSSGLLPRDLDFIYIDGDHSFQQCFRDIQNALCHVNDEGFIGGHDFTSYLEMETVEVIDAVVHFAVKNQVIPTLKFPDYWFKKADFSKGVNA